MKTKKTIILFACLMASVCSSAQLKVNNNGLARIAYNPSTSHGVLLSVGDSLSGSYFKYGINGNGAYSSVDLTSAGSVGVRGVAGNAIQNNYGVMGALSGSNNGACIYGSTVSSNLMINGQYAGYFNGETYVHGTLTVNEVFHPSDIRLKENISLLANDGNRGALENVLAMNVLEYNYKKHEISDEDIRLAEELYGKEAAEELRNGEKSHDAVDCNRLHFGVSAQELQTIYPNLVREGQDGYLAVNYVELVPVLIRSIQELKEELDDMKGNGTVRKAPSKQPTYVEKEGFITENVLYQNTPNPFKESTEIRFSLADDARDAAICIFDMQGKLLKKMPVSTGTESITVNGYELGEGMFLYSLIVNGQEIDTKRMILTK